MCLSLYGLLHVPKWRGVVFLVWEQSLIGMCVVSVLVVFKVLELLS